MKKWITRSLMVALTTVSLNVFAQFEGVIEFDKTSSETTRYIYYVKGDQVRIEEKGTDGNIKGIQLVNMKTKKVTAISPERKLWMDVTNTKSHPAPDVDVEKTGNKKTIAGYECTEWIVKNPGEDTEITYWATDGFGFFDEFLETLNRKDKLTTYFLEVEGNDDVFTFKGIERSLDGTVRTTLEVKSVEEKQLSNSLFEIPEGFVKFEK